MDFRLMLVAHNFTTVGHNSAWYANMLVTKDATVGTTTVYLSTPTTLGTDAQTVSVTADTATGCVNATVTPPNTDTWDYNMRFDAVVGG
jgi:hypothetical protein